MDFAAIIGYIAPLIVIGLTQLLKKWIQTKFAPIVVFALGGLSALLGIGPAPGPEYVGTIVNVGWVSGLATLLYDLVRKLTKDKSVA